jgi:large subunit ribosomal protein L14
MLQKESKLFIADNSGAKYVKCIRIIKKNYGRLGDFILIVLQIFNRKKKLIKKKKYKGLIISTSSFKNRPNGTQVKFTKNRIILFFEKDKFAGTRIYGPICREIRNKSLYFKFRKLISYAHRIV